MPLIIGQCDEDDCEREAMEGYERCAYHRAVEERKKYQNLKDAGMIGSFIIVASMLGRKAFKLGKYAIEKYAKYRS
jgi:hypothetical protein